VRVTANDGDLGEKLLKEFQDNDKTIPTVLTTSQKLSTGVDALNVRNIVLLRPINSMIEFKQIIGRGTRLYDGKYYFTIYDFVKAYENFQDPTWDGEPVCPVCGNNPCTCEAEALPYEFEGDEDKLTEVEEPRVKYRPSSSGVCTVCGQDPCVCKKPEKLEIRLSDGRTRRIKYLKSDMFWGADGKPVSAEEFLNTMFGQLPEFYGDIKELQEKWSNPKTREELLELLDEAGYGIDVLKQIRTLIDAENSDLLDVLEYISYNIDPIERTERAGRTEKYILSLPVQEQEFVQFIRNLYVKQGVEELGASKLPDLIAMKYGSLPDGMKALGGVNKAKDAFVNFQRHLYAS
jgi:type I restriction enzyme R subunit